MLIDGTSSLEFENKGDIFWGLQSKGPELSFPLVPRTHFARCRKTRGGKGFSVFV
jgi:hypothetical protein